MNIGQVAARTGLPVKTIRYYEDIGLITPGRGDNGYRDFGDQDVSWLHFVAQARHLGFSLDECRRLMALYCNKNRASRDVRALAQDHLAEVRNRIVQLQSLETTLVAMIADCSGNDDPDCAILNKLATSQPHPPC
jgi:MerR family copper efflux transcriptional regulator